MLKINYQKILEVKYSYLLKKGVDLFKSIKLSVLLKLPHPAREEAFVKWALASGPELAPYDSSHTVSDSN